MRRSIWLASTSLVVVSFACVSYAQSSTETYSYDALGRLIKVVTAGGQNNAETQSYCYDDAGNRTDVVSNTSNGSTTCSGGSAPPPPPPPPPPSNGAPNAVADFASGACGSTINVNLTANDTDPDGDPLTLVSITKTSGQGGATVLNSSTARVTLGTQAFETASYTYTVRDPSNATDTAPLTVFFTCSGGGPLF